MGLYPSTHIRIILTASGSALLQPDHRQMQILLTNLRQPIRQRIIIDSIHGCAHQLHLTGAVVHFGCAADNPLRVFFHIGISLRGHAPDLHLHMRMLTDDIPSGSRDHLSHIYPGISLTAPGNGVQIQYRRSHGQHGVFPFFRRSRRMGSFSIKFHIIFHSSQTLTTTDSDGCFLLLRSAAHMGAKHKVNIVQMSVLHNGLRASHAFLRWLEDKLHRSVKLFPQLAENFGRSQSYRHMAVMAAGMHDACIAGRKSLFRRVVRLFLTFQYRQRVHIKTEGHRRSFAAMQNSNHTGESTFCTGQIRKICALLGRRLLIMPVQFLLRRQTHPRFLQADLPSHQHLVTAEVFQIRCNDRGCPHFHPAKLRIAMKIPPYLHKLRFHGLRLFCDLRINLSALHSVPFLFYLRISGYPKGFAGLSQVPANPFPHFF